MPGLYDIYPGEDWHHQSHDNLTGMSVFSVLYGHKWHEGIWHYAKQNKFRYDNVFPENPSWKRILHPRDIIFYGFLNKNWLAYLGLPLLFIMMLVSFTSDRTNGRILWYFRSLVLPSVFMFVWKIFNSLKDLFEIRLVPASRTNSNIWRG